MTTEEENNDYPFNSDYEEKLLLDELISTPYSVGRLYISSNHTFAYVHEKTRYDTTCKTASGNFCVCSEKGSRLKLAWLKAKGGQIGVC
jgi:hypothetical protein